MNQHVRSMTPLMWGVLIFSGAIALTGIVLIALGATGDTDFSLFGQTFKSTNAGITALFIAAIVAVVLGRRIIGAMENTTTIEINRRPDSILHRYEKLREGTSTPDQNVALIEEIANSNDPHKEKYLSEISTSSIFSFLERDAAKAAVNHVHAGENAVNLFDLTTQKEKEKLIAGLGIGDGSDDSQFWQVVFSLKYWRYINRPGHPQYAEVQTQLASATNGKISLKELSPIRDEFEP